MLTNERHEIILQLLKEKETIKTQDIIDATDASESTIRRDLNELENNQELVRIHGGATVNDRRLRESSIAEKSTQYIQAKQKIAEYAASLIHDGESIYLDAGTTTLQMIPFLQGKQVTIVTNGLTHVEELMKFGLTTYLTGGKIKVKTNALIGPRAIESLTGYRFDKCFLGVNGFDLTSGFTTPDPEEASIKRTAQTLAKSSYVLADQSKFNRVTFAQISEIHSATIITSHLNQEDIYTLEQHTNIKDVMT